MFGKGFDSMDAIIEPTWTYLRRPLTGTPAPKFDKQRNMHKITYTSSRLCGGLVTRLTGRREYVHVSLTAAIPAADTCQSSHHPPFRQLSKLFHARSKGYNYFNGNASWKPSHRSSILGNRNVDTVLSHNLWSAEISPYIPVTV